MRTKSSFPQKLFSVVNITLMLMFVAVCIYPFYYLLIYSFSESTQASLITIWPRGFTLNNYIEVFTLNGFGRAAIVSVLRTVVGSVLSVGCCSFFAYLVSKEIMVGRKLIYRMLVITMYMDGGLVPTFLVMNAYGLMDSYWIYILPGLLGAYNVVLLKTFMEQIPAALEESATIDGAGVIRCWWSIVLPLSKPALATIAVFSAVGQWNAWFDAHIYVTERAMWPLQYILYRYLQEAQAVASLLDEMRDASAVTVNITPATIRMTITAVVTIPILVVYPFMQKFFMKGIMLGAVKG